MNRQGLLTDIVAFGCLQRKPPLFGIVPISVESHWLDRKGPRPPLLPPSGFHRSGQNPGEPAASAASHSEQRWGVKVGLRGRMGRGLGDGGKQSRFALAFESRGMFLIGQRFPRAAGWGWGTLGLSRESVEGAWGTLFPKTGLWSLRAGRPPPPAAGPGGAVTQ